jgi:hypothetical protein
MNCQEFWNSIPPPEPGKPLRADAGQQAHLAECVRCAGLFRRHVRLANDLSALGAEMGRSEAPSRVESRLACAFRAQAGLPPVVPIRRWRAPILWAAAAALLLSASVAVLEQRRPAPQPAHRNRPSAVELAQWALPPEIELDNAGVADADGFIPVPDAARLTAGEEPMDLVRVEMPRSSLIAFGFPVGVENASENIEADVLVGPDGLARAVRFLD